MKRISIYKSRLDALAEENEQFVNENAYLKSEIADLKARLEEMEMQIRNWAK